ncbi:nuclear body protein SP140-like protein isoform 2-T2 [Clarias gariepinus]|uniref:nuclear body protein SP140-like protein isoform X2 n=1 Tax=Clarias gariepinus TaxID=13013 RepID=UPI00234DFCB1|nr:nuclear body protein SP140-like protein isoform X2 [Clarias gariepinus]
MNRLDCLTEEEMITFFRFNKTRISCIEEPQTFLTQLRDRDLVPEELYGKVMNMKIKKIIQKGLYDILDWVETNRGHCIKQFWSSVFEDHIMQKYPVFHTLQKKLFNETKKGNSEVARGDKKLAQKKSATKRKKCGEETGEDKSGASSVTSKKKQAKEPKTCPLLKAGTPPVTGGDKKGKKEEKQDRFPEPGPSSLTSKKKQAKTPKICEEHILFQNMSPEPGTSSLSSKKKSAKKPEANILTKTSETLLLKSEPLLVTCGDKTGTLYPDELAKGEGCVLSEGRWFTPNDFLRFSGKGSSNNWKKAIRYQNAPLLKLFKEGHLPWPDNRFRGQKSVSFGSTESSSLRTEPCDKVKREENEDDVCCICHLKNDLVFCYGCLQDFHHYCHLPTLQENTVGDKWICTFCVFNANQEIWIPKSKKDALSSPFTDNILCQYLLLRLYKADTDRVFTSNPSDAVPGYRNVISNPMWLGKVRTKMEKDKYKTVKQFVLDIQLIFKNCQTFYKDNMYGKKGAEMKEMFDEDFNTVFKIL